MSTGKMDRDSAELRTPIMQAIRAGMDAAKDLEKSRRVTPEAWQARVTA